jgi:hypothetical protein
METVGTITVIVAGIIIVGGIVVGVLSSPDIKRYLRMRSM